MSKFDDIESHRVTRQSAERLAKLRAEGPALVQAKQQRRRRVDLAVASVNTRIDAQTPQERLQLVLDRLNSHAPRLRGREKRKPLLDMPDPFSNTQQAIRRETERLKRK